MTGAVLGLSSSYLKPAVKDVVWPFRLTTTSTGPAIVLAGVFAAMTSAPRTVTSVAGRPPIEMVAPAAKPVPRMVISVPPVAGPAVGLTDWIASAAGTGPGFVGELQLRAAAASAAAANRA